MKMTAPDVLMTRGRSCRTGFYRKLASLKRKVGGTGRNRGPPAASKAGARCTVPPQGSVQRRIP
jgi:hypothetical protein